MGLFDDLKKSALGKIMETVEKSVGNAVGGTANSPREEEAPAQSYTAPQSGGWTSSENRYADPAPVGTAQRFDQILAAEFAGFEVFTVSLTGNKYVKSSHNVVIEADAGVRIVDNVLK